MKSVVAARTACVDLPGFALQLLFQQHPEWRNTPTAVISKETGSGKILMASASAQKRGITAGLRYASALGLVPELRAAAVPGNRIKNSTTEVLTCLQTFSPKVQATRKHSGTFWMVLSGIERLYPSIDLWAKRVLEALRRIGLKAVVV
ncbi:MAG: DNA polymerase Y family protein, partial [Deltaproteobacteria bacterium]|nr:DNA polymerase Y family protein [Deltaproteobacteria bacterium]